MELANIVASLRRSKFGAILVALQIALTLAIVSNALFVIRQRAELLSQPTGIDEDNIFTMRNTFAWNQEEEEKNQASTQRDLEILRAVPGVIDAFCASGLPLLGGYEGDGFSRRADLDQSDALVPVFRVDDHGLNTLGLKLLAGRWFRSEEVVKSLARPRSAPPLVITRSLAVRLFPEGGAVGAKIYSYANHRSAVQSTSTIIGVVETLRIPGEGFLAGMEAVMYPWRRTGQEIYVVRAQPGKLRAVMQEVEPRLRSANPLRVISDLEPYTETRIESLSLTRSTVFILVTVCALLLAVTGAGIVGLTSYWIAQRRRHIGMRRALGARRLDIIAYYQTENLLIASIGAAFGIPLAVAINLWLVKSFSMPRMQLGYIIGGALMVIVLGQLAAFWPARRAASVAPAIATRAA